MNIKSNRNDINDLTTNLFASDEAQSIQFLLIEFLIDFYDDDLTRRFSDNHFLTKKSKTKRFCSIHIATNNIFYNNGLI